MNRNKLLPSDGINHATLIASDENMERLNSCGSHSFITDSTGTLAICSKCGALLPIALAEWYGYGYLCGLRKAEGLLRSTGLLVEEEFLERKSYE